MSKQILLESPFWKILLFTSDLWDLYIYKALGKHIVESHCFEESCFSRCIPPLGRGETQHSSSLNLSSCFTTRINFKMDSNLKLGLDAVQSFEKQFINTSSPILPREWPSLKSAAVLLFCPNLINYFFFLLLWISSCPSSCRQSITFEYFQQVLNERTGKDWAALGLSNMGWSDS